MLPSGPTAGAFGGTVPWGNDVGAFAGGVAAAAGFVAASTGVSPLAGASGLAVDSAFAAPSGFGAPPAGLVPSSADGRMVGSLARGSSLFAAAGTAGGRVPRSAVIA